jgi:hypothetical protein
MKQVMKKGLVVIIGLVLLLSFFGSIMNAAPNPNPTWYVDARCVFHGQCLPYDYYAAKDPTIVYSGGKYHVFYTGANQSGGWQMLYTSATTISGLATASRTYMSKIGESYFCAPEVFYFEPQSKWYLVYQDGTYGAAYSTSTNIADPNSWSGPYSFGISGNMGWDYYIICDDTYAYMYNTPDSGNHNIYMRKTTLANFPAGWSAPTVAMSDTFEGAAVYKSLADGQYYTVVEDMKDGRYYELWSSSSAGGPWTKVAEKWAWRGNLSYNADQWTTNVSHGELIRAGVNQKLEINDINHVDFLIQGTTNTSGTYQQIIWDLGVIHNYTGSYTPGPTPTPTPTSNVTPTPTPTPGGNLITNLGIETGNTTGWAVNGAGTISASTAQKHSGTYSLLHTGRTATWNGPIQNITSKVQSGRTYACSGWVRLDNTASANVIMTMKKVDGSGTTYTNINSKTGSNSSWVQLSGNYTLSVSGTLTELSIYFEGPASGINYYLDDVSVQ